MDINILREAVTVASFLAFLGVVRYAMHPRNRERFEDAAMAVLAEEGRDPHPDPLPRQRGRDPHPDPLPRERGQTLDAVASKEASTR
jgi:cbb3-type cytochrome oxidase subunit 3